MITTPFLPAPDSKEAWYSLDSPQGRGRRFKDRIEELTRPKSEGGKGLTIDEALFEMRTGDNPEDRVLLEAMGEKTSHFRVEKLQQQKHLDNLHRLAEENKNALKDSREVAAALARNIAFNVRLDELTALGLSVDEAINKMRSNRDDATLLAAMSGA